MIDTKFVCKYRLSYETIPFQNKDLMLIFSVIRLLALSANVMHASTLMYYPMSKLKLIEEPLARMLIWAYDLAHYRGMVMFLIKYDFSIFIFYIA